MKTRLLVLLLFCTLPVWSQTLDLPLDRGTVGLSQALGRLPLTSRVLFITAHPDDEPAGLLTFVSRGMHAKTALLSLTRGEGGQNLIGSELFDALGLVRTGEMLAADEYYGVEQFFTRAFDFGFSKSPEETLRMWDREKVLCDMVRAIRKFRPDVIVSVWQGNSQDGHGHHQACGLLAREAFGLSGNSRRFQELLQEGLSPWQAKKFYIVAKEEKSSDRLSFNTGAFVPLFGASYDQLGAHGYSQHRTQGAADSYASAGWHWQSVRQVFPVGAARNSGSREDLPEASPLRSPTDSKLLEGCLTNLSDLPALLSADDPKRAWLIQQVATINRLISQAQQAFSITNLNEVPWPLVECLEKLRAIRQQLPAVALNSLPQDHLQFLVDSKEQDFLRAIELSAAISFEALADQPRVTPQQAFGVTATVVNRSSLVIIPREIKLEADAGWMIQQAERSQRPLQPGERLVLRFNVVVPQDAKLTQPSWRRAAKTDRMYSITNMPALNDPLPPPVLRAQLTYSLAALKQAPGNSAPIGSAMGKHEASQVELTLTRPVGYLDSDRFKGTRVIPLLVTSPLSIEVAPSLQLIALSSSSRSRGIRVRLANNSKQPLAGALRLKAPFGWQVQPESHSFNFTEQNQTAVFLFQVSPPEGARAGHYSLRAVASVAGQEYDQSCRMISVLDRWTIPLYSQAETEALLLDVRIPDNLKIGYIMGAGDRVPQTLEQLGVSFDQLGPDDLAEADLRPYSCIITGIRAYEVRKDLATFNQRLLEYVRNGGVYIVQYNTPAAWNKTPYAPYPARIVSAAHRVTDETAPVTILDPAHPLFNFPNHIVPEDFDGWVQERGLYFIQERDSHFKPLLSCNDPGEPPLDGGLLIAEYGKGLYVLTSYSWFRQLPEGVAGAIRVFANLISLSPSQRK